MLRRISHFFLPVAICFSLIAVATAEEPVPNKFNALEFKGKDDGVLKYQFFVPKKSKSKEKSPLLIFLHGAGERGDNNTSQLKHGRSAMKKFGEDTNGYVIAPQCPRETTWCLTSWKAKEHRMPEVSKPMALLKQVIDQTMKDYPIDPNRVYVMGLSMGGFGTFDAIQRYPEIFAAAVPICGGGDVEGAKTMKDIPIWAFHGDKDTAINVSRSRDMVAALKKVGGSIKYTEYPGKGHGIWNTVFADQEMWKWLIAQKKK